MPKTNRWHPVKLPDDYLRKLKQDLAEADEIADPSTLLEPDPEQTEELPGNETSQPPLPHVGIYTDAPP